MELQDKYKNGKTTMHANGFKKLIENDPSKFEIYKKLGFDIFKGEVKPEPVKEPVKIKKTIKKTIKKKSDSTNKG